MKSPATLSGKLNTGYSTGSLFWMRSYAEKIKSQFGLRNPNHHKLLANGNNDMENVNNVIAYMVGTHSDNFKI